MKTSEQSMMCRTEEYLGVLNLEGGGRFARTTSFGGLKTCSPRNLRKTFTQVVNILETYETEIENLSAKSSSSNPRRILFNIKSNSSLKDSFLKVLDFLKILCFSVLQ